MLKIFLCIAVLLSVAHGKLSRDEWIARITNLTEDFSEWYRTGGGEDVKVMLMTVDVHIAVPWYKPVLSRSDAEPRKRQQRDFTMTFTELRYFCGDGAVFEFDISFMAPDAKFVGHGLANVRQNPGSGRVKFASISWSYIRQIKVD